MIERPMYADKIMAYVDTPFVKILTGVRRCGKSTLLKMIMERLKSEHNVPENRILSYRFDSMEYDGAIAKQIYSNPVCTLMERRICSLMRYRRFRAGRRS